MYQIKNIVLVFAQSRSGHHAIIDWLYNQFANTRLFFNYNDPNNFDPMFANRVQYYLNDKKYYRVISKSWITAGIVEEKKKEFILENIENIDIIENKVKNLLILNYENIDVKDIQKVFLNVRGNFPAANIYKVFVVRDLLNLVASKIKSGREISLNDVSEKNNKPDINHIYSVPSDK